MATELLSVEQAFYTGDYASVISADAHSDERIAALQVRALAAQGETQQALSHTEGHSSPLFDALRAYLAKSIPESDAVLASNSDNDSVRHIVALTHAAQGEWQSALQIISESGHYLDSSLLKVHILLALNRNSEAIQVIDDTREWANDHIIYNLGEALACLRDPSTAQKSYFIFEENNSVHPSANSSLGEAVANMVLHRFPEASESMTQAVSNESEASLISALSLALIQGDAASVTEIRTKLQLAKFKDSAYTADLKAKEEAFDRVLERFKA